MRLGFCCGPGALDVVVPSARMVGVEGDSTEMGMRVSSW